MRGSRVSGALVLAPVVVLAAASVAEARAVPLSTPGAAGLLATARSYLQARAAELVTDVGGGAAAVRSLATLPMSATLQTESARDLSVLAARRQAEHAAGVDYVRAAVELTNPALSTASDGTTTLRATDDTRLYFKPVPGAPPYEEWSVLRSFTFAHSTTVPILASASLAGTNGPLTSVDVSSNEEAAVQGSSSPASGPDANIPAGAASTIQPAISSRSVRTSRSKVLGGMTPAINYYNYSAMINFETTNWNTTLTPSWNDDCTNFLSRALLAGGWAEVSRLPYGADRNYNNVWYDSYMEGRGGHWWYSYSWSVSNNWNMFARGSGRVTALSNVWYTLASDVLQAQWAGTSSIDHSMMVTAVDANNGHYVTYHSNNTVNRPLIDILRANPGSIWYADST